ncbi:uncharacterized protein isoform X3 [Leptinotarsa decemlineata]|uniref:uncharacterized protein isoform X3 n=1 Tax=Leptinotarsa decemlineata TaxID=7539 RepID=UPI003D30CD70
MHKYIFLYVLILSLHYSQSSVEDEVKELIKKIQNAIPEPINFSEINISVPDNKYISLSLSDLSMNASVSIDLQNPLNKLKINLGGAQLGITGFLDDPDYNNELSEELSESIPLIVNSEGFSSLVEKTLNGIVASIFKKKNDTTVSVPELSVTGFLNDPDYSHELSEELPKSIPLIVNSEEFSSLVETIINDIIANLFEKKNDATVSVPAIDGGAERRLFVVDFLNALRIWVED